eukprot:1982392-Prymnesium_polylepis.1
MGALKSALPHLKGLPAVAAEVCRPGANRRPARPPVLLLASDGAAAHCCSERSRIAALSEAALLL